MLLGMMKHEGQLADQILQVMGNEGEALADLLKSLHRGERAGGLLLHHIARNLDAQDAEQILVLPCQLTPCPRLSQHDHADHLVAGTQRQREPGVAQILQPGPDVSLREQRRECFRPWRSSSSTSP